MKHQTGELSPDSLIDIKYMQNDSKFTAKYYYSQIKAGKLASPIKIGRCSRWKLSDYLDWKNSHIQRMRA
ncbi:AlpA family transcriptional regulator [Biostraticola tofi]|uniref:AlpA family transcriptional regulator n=1 Tax=Biostraticola tofi TaxID=466109 RepID=A0A4R3Z5C6_9GAMM|nr:AlpA family transcriptional regulator [Biostraticola tofi]